jgi:hypothetical protein
VFYYIQDDTEATLLRSQVATIVVLTKGCKSATIVRDLADIPAGCGATAVTPTVAVHVLVKVSMTCIGGVIEKLMSEDARVLLILSQRSVSAIRS